MADSTQICVSCGREFNPEIPEPIPVCAECKMEEQVTTLTPSAAVKDAYPDFVRAPDESRGSIEELPEEERTVTGTLKAPLGSGWKVRKSDGRIFGPFPSETVSQWALEGKITDQEEVARMNARGVETWEPIAECPTFTHLFQRKPEPLPDFVQSMPVEIPEVRREPRTPAPLVLEPVRRDPRAEEPEDLFDEPIEEIAEPAAPSDQPLALELEMPEEDLSLFGERRSLGSRWLKKSIIVPLIVLCVGAVVAWAGKTYWRSISGKAAQMMPQKPRELDRVDQYIDNYRKELGAVQGDAVEFYREANEQYELETMAGWEKAERLFKSVLVLKPEHVAALSGLSETYSQMAALRQDTDLFTVAYDLSYRALKLEPASGPGNRAVAHLFIRLNNRQAEAKAALDKALAANAQDARSYALLGEWAAQQQQDKSAQEFFEKALQLNPALESARYHLGQVHLRQYGFAKASAAWLKIRDGQAAHSYYGAPSRFELGRLYLALGQYKKAAEFAQQALNLDPTFVDAQVLYADLLIQFLGASTQAEQLLTERMRQSASMTEIERKQIQTLLAVAQATNGKMRDAQQNLRAVLAQDNYFRVARYDLGLASLALGERDDAVKQLETLRGWNEAPVVYPYYMAQSLQKFEDRAQEAVQTYQDLIAAQPDLPHGHVGLAKLLMALANEKGAEETLWRACQTRLDFLEDHQWRTFLTLGGGLDVATVLKEHERHLQKNIYSVEALGGYAYLLAISGKPDQALTVLERALAQDPQDLPVLQLYAHLLIRQGKAARAVEMTRTALKLAPQDADVLLILAEGYVRTSRYTLAKGHLESLLDQPKVPARAHYLMGLVHRGMNEPDKAIAEWIETVKRDPTEIAAKVALFEAGY